METSLQSMFYSFWGFEIAVTLISTWNRQLEEKPWHVIALWWLIVHGNIQLLISAPLKELPSISGEHCTSQQDMAWIDYLKAAETAFSFEAMHAASLWHILRHKAHNGTQAWREETRFSFREKPDGRKHRMKWCNRVTCFRALIVMVLLCGDRVWLAVYNDAHIQYISLHGRHHTEDTGIIILFYIDIFYIYIDI